MRRWRGNLDIPLTDQARIDSKALGKRLRLDIIYHDVLSRCKDTARYLNPKEYLVQDSGPRPWSMGWQFEGKEITDESLAHAESLVKHPFDAPMGGECFSSWYEHWIQWINGLRQDKAIGVVTHNRNIQALYSTHNGKFFYNLYNVIGPDFLSVHYYKDGSVAPWGEVGVPTGIYLIRHGETEYGT